MLLEALFGHPVGEVQEETGAFGKLGLVTTNTYLGLLKILNTKRTT